MTGHAPPLSWAQQRWTPEGRGGEKQHKLPGLLQGRGAGTQAYLGEKGRPVPRGEEEKTDCKGCASAEEWIDTRWRRQGGRLTGGLGAQAGR